MKYTMHICKCGHIHMIPNEKIDAALKEELNFVLVCADCGNTWVIGADIEPDCEDPDKNCYMMYGHEIYVPYGGAVSIDFADFNPQNGEHKAYSEIYLSHGIKVPMKTGEYARQYFCNQFADMWYPDFYKIKRSDITLEEVMRFIEDFEHDHKTVDMDRFIRENDDEILQCISGYIIRAFDWTGTKCERK